MIQFCQTGFSGEFERCLGVSYPFRKWTLSIHLSIQDGLFERPRYQEYHQGGNIQPDDLYVSPGSVVHERWMTHLAV